MYQQFTYPIQSLQIQQGDDHWRLLETFRIRKNEIFEGCITDKTRELLK